MIEIAVVEAVRSIGSWTDIHIAKVIVHNVDGIVRRRTYRTLIESIVEATSFKFSEDFGEETGFGVDAQHAWAEAVQEK